MINCKIESDFDSLDSLYQKTEWTPNSSQVRPSDVVLNKKREEINEILNKYNSLKDYILHTIFKIPVVKEDGKLRSKDYAENNNCCLFINKYPYNLNFGTKHYILWYLNSKKIKHDQEITKDIRNRLGKKTEFVWMENPKMSIPELYHVQIFVRFID